MATGMLRVLLVGSIDISVGASATLSAAVAGVLYRAMVNGGMANGVAFAIAILAVLRGLRFRHRQSGRDAGL